MGTQFHSSYFEKPVYAGILSGVFKEGQNLPRGHHSAYGKLPLSQYVHVKIQNETSGSKSKMQE